MQSVLRSIRVQPPGVLSSPLSYNLCRKSSGSRFQQAVAGTNRPESVNGMDQSAQKRKAKGDTMASFGEGYATRSDEEGFGGIYRGNQDLPSDDEEKIVHAKTPEYDKSQGSEVKETEKARHQKDAHS